MHFFFIFCRQKKRWMKMLLFRKNEPKCNLEIFTQKITTEQKKNKIMHRKACFLESHTVQSIVWTLATICFEQQQHKRKPLETDLNRQFNWDRLTLIAYCTHGFCRHKQNICLQLIYILICCFFFFFLGHFLLFVSVFAVIQLVAWNSSLESSFKEQKNYFAKQQRKYSLSILPHPMNGILNENFAFFLKLLAFQIC